MTTKDHLKQAQKMIELATQQIKKNPTPLTKTTVNAILKLQRMVVELRNQAIILHRVQGHSLAEIAAQFELSPSRVSQIARGVRPATTRRIRVKK